MPENRNPKNGRSGARADGARTMEDSIRQAFLTHMGEQQRQFAVVPVAVRRAGDRDADRELAEKVRQQQHTGSHDKPEREAAGSDLRGGARTGAENVEPKRR